MSTETLQRSMTFSGRKGAWLRLLLLSLLLAYGLYTLGLLVKAEYRGERPQPRPRPWPAHLESP